MNTAAVRARSTPSTAATSISNLCRLDVDGALYAGTDRWLPAGLSAFCHGEAYPGLPGRAELASQMASVGSLEATITFVAPTDIQLDLYCSRSLQQRSADADFVSAADAQDLYQQVCT
jgi:hypothetical protein